MSLAVTQTQQESNQIVFTLLSPENHDQLDRLADILERFQNCNDDLSQQLFKWGSNAVILTAIAEGMDLSEFKVKVEKELETLAREILVNPMTHQPLQVPLIDREWVWEKSILDDYLELSNISPFDGLPIQAKTHEFALAMINWLKDVHDTNQIALPVDKDKSAIGNLIKPEVSDDMRLNNYYHLAKCAHNVKSLRILQNAFNATEKMYEENAEIIRKHIIQQEEKLQKYENELNDSQKKRLEILREEFLMKTLILKSQMSDLEKENNDKEIKLTDAQKIMGALFEEHAKLQIERLRDKEEIQKLRDKVDDMCVIL